MTYLSPTSLKLFTTDREKFFLQYIASPRMVRPPQTEPMSVGSAFDAYVKSYLVEKIKGNLKDHPEFQLTNILNAQVEPHLRDFAFEAGRNVFNAYEKLGALADILLDLEGSLGDPQFETTLEGYVTAEHLEVGGIPFLGKPDIAFLAKQGARVITDWKVNGYCGKATTSPSPGYVRIRTADKKNGTQHPKAIVMLERGVRISAMHPLNVVNSDWADQLSIYAWILGEPVGSRFIVAIDQIACGWDCFGEREFRVAQHRSIIPADYQIELFKKAHHAWYTIQSGHIFDTVSRMESDDRCALLQQIASTPADPAFDSLITKQGWVR